MHGTKKQDTMHEEKKSFFFNVYEANCSTYQDQFSIQLLFLSKFYIKSTKFYACIASNSTSIYAACFILTNTFLHDVSLAPFLLLR